jgi:penicillin-binding protein 1A
MFSRLITTLISIAFLGIIGAVALVAGGLIYFGRDLPDYKALANYEPPIVTRAYASDGRLLAEFATEKRVYVPIDSVPALVIHAFISAEDKHFYTHAGIDPMGILRAVLTNLRNAGSDKRPKGASTITQQVAKNFLLSDILEEEKGNKLAKYRRKVKEAILSFRIEQTYTKDQILQLYLNEIYLGSHAYGIAAAALEYFDKPMDELTVEEAAFLAALPKAPNNYAPERHYAAALERRNWVIDQMTENGFIRSDESFTAKTKPITLVKRSASEYVNHPYFAEEVRRKLQELYGDKGLYEGGLIAKTTLLPAYQKIAETALRHGLINYDVRYGLHSQATAHIDIKGKWQEALAQTTTPPGAENFRMAVILETGDKKAVIGFSDGEKAVIPYENMRWAHKRNTAPPAHVSDVLKTGDVWPTENSGEKTKAGEPAYWLRQIPDVSGGIVVMDPHTGRVFALAGGFSYELSEFDRATQAQRQPGSAFKPFVYLTALEAGFTPATLILDAPIVLEQGPGMPKWKPQNYHQDYNGPTPLRVGLEKSLNLMTIRLANYVGMDKIVETTQRFGVMDHLPPYLSYALGAGETTLWRMVAGYSVFVNGGKKIVPTLIDRIQDRNGKTIYAHDQAGCADCGPLIPWSNQAAPETTDPRPQIADPRNMYQLVSMMEGVVQHGTAMYTGLNKLGFPVAGKTGTTNDSKDTWFIGFTPDLVVGAYVGFDEPKSLGPKETGARVAAPIIKEFMETALKDVPPVPFRVPQGIRLVEVNRHDGVRAKPGDAYTILEAFVEGTEPGDEPVMFNGKTVSSVSDVTTVGEGADTGLGGLY